MLFNAEAELLHESEHPIFVYPNGCYFCGDGERFSGMLCRGDNGVAQMWLAEARAFANGWYVTATPGAYGKDTVVSLYDGDDVLVAQSIYGMDFDEEHLCYVLQGKDGKCSMHDDGGKELISGAGRHLSARQPVCGAEGGRFEPACVWLAGGRKNAAGTVDGNDTAVRRRDYVLRRRR